MTDLLEEGQKTKNEGEGEEGTTSTQNTATSAGGKDESTTQTQTKKPVVFSSEQQEQVSKLIGAARVQSREGAVASALKDLGFENVDSLKDVLKAHSDTERAKLSELEAAQTDLATLQGVNQRATDLETSNTALLAVIEGQAKSLMETLNVPEHVKPLIEAMPIAERLAYLTEHGKEFAEETTTTTTTTNKPNINSGGKGGNGEAVQKSQLAKLKHKYNIK